MRDVWKGGPLFKNIPQCDPSINFYFIYQLFRGINKEKLKNFMKVALDVVSLAGKVISCLPFVLLRHKTLLAEQIVVTDQSKHQFK